MSKLKKVFAVATKPSSIIDLCTFSAELGEQVGLIYLGARECAVNADKAYYLGNLENTSYSSCIGAIVNIIAEEKPELILVDLTKNGRLAAAHIAVSMETGVMSDVSELVVEDGAVITKRMVYGGSAVKTERLSGCAVVCLTPPAQKDVQTVPAAEIVDVAVEACGITLTGKADKVVQAVNLNAASRVVGVGRGFATEESLEIAKSFAKAFEAEIGCTRPIAEEERWLPTERYIGVSGVMIKPAIYVAAGISGQVQHTVGINDAGIILAINKDEHAPIFENCDFGIIGDVAEVLPALEALIKY